MGGRSTERRRLGGSAVEVTQLGLGTAPLGGLFTHVEDDVATAVVRTALDAGLGYVDTAPLYGHGTAERRVGAALAGVDRSRFVLSSKVGRLIVDNPAGNADGYVDREATEATFDYSRDGIHRSLEESLVRLGLDSVDILYIHDPDDHEDEALTVAYPALNELRDQGVVKAIGVGMNQSRIPTRFVRETDVNAVLLAGRYTLLDQSGNEDLLPACLERGASVVIGGVYNSGLLADPKPGATYDYAEAPPALVERAQELGEICASHGVPLKAAAIQFPLAHPAVATVLTGARSVDELDENITMMEYTIPDALWSDLAAAGAARHAG
ncbi:aldo/keto reductase [Tenggerimyces flavus]|uniref:Aldo/keto reductase n=1 Tax=Tenggerimyces flavus TaxID=1708749 RepID=A0ABV7YQL3_9ACTN|nr:aldo/keto reductase [Tenggerimyces flavus]MBM7788745.1 D-threo-aldose 1-dehydrogenase [Tenggerimyces flavus]